MATKVKTAAKKTKLPKGAATKIPTALNISEAELQDLWDRCEKLGEVPLKGQELWYYYGEGTLKLSEDQFSST
jgi:hypothetical protein